MRAFRSFESWPKMLRKILENQERFVVVDFQNTLWKSWMAKPGAGLDLQRSTDNYPTGHIFRFFRTIYKWKRDFQGHLVFCYEGGEKKRYELFPGYKAGRKRDIEFNPAPDVMRLLSMVKCTELRPEAAEADDAIAGFIQRKPEALHLILSSDKDLWTLRGPNVQIVSFQKILTEDDIQKSCNKHYGVGLPKSITLAKALFGDKSDGLPGVPRLLKKHVSDVLAKAETPDDLFSLLNELPDKTADKIREHEAHVRKMYEVVQLRPEVRLKRRERDGDEQGLRDFVNEFECSSLQPMVKLLCL